MNFQQSGSDPKQNGAGAAAGPSSAMAADGFTGLAELSPDGVLVIQDEWLVYANKGALDILRAGDVDQVVRHPVLDFLPQDYRTAVKERLARVQAGAPEVLMGAQLLCLDGTFLPVEIRAGAIHWHGENAVQVLIRQESRISEESFRTLVEGIAQSVWETDAEGQVLLSPSWCAYTGQTQHEFLTGQWIDAVHPEDRNRILLQWRDALATRKQYNAEYRLRHDKDGWRWTNSRAEPLLGPDGTVRKWVGMNIDITDRKAAEAQLRESEARFRRALKPQNAGVIFFNSDRLVTEANDAFLRMSGYSRQDVSEGRLRWDSMTPPEWMEASLRAAEEFKSRGYSTPYEKEYIRKDGSRWWGLFAGTCVSETEFVEYVIDITEQKRAEYALRESESRFRALADASPALIWRLDALGNIAYLNQRHTDVTGSDPEYLQAMGWQAFVHPDDLRGWSEACGRLRHDRGRFQRRIRIRTKDSQWHWFEAYAAPWSGADGEYRGHVGISIDVTDAVQAENALREADRRKDDFLATLAHELRNPLAPIGNAVHLLRRPDGRRVADRLIEMVGRQVNHIVRLVDDLLEVSRITRGKIQLSKEPVALRDIVAGALEISRPVVDQANHRLTVSLPDEPIVLDVDKVRVTQALTNLLSNAAKYTAPGGQIWVSARREDGDAVISVRDSGIGIAPEQLPIVFDMFTQLHRAVGHGYGGLGIGLTMARSLIEMHGGSITAHSLGQGHGSEFAIRLALADAAQPRAAEQSHPHATATAPLFGQRILVVDDNRDAADSLALLLEHDGAAVDTAYDGREALSAAEKNRPHAVILDIGMPGMDGYEVAAEMRRNPGFDGIRLIALTGWGQRTDRLRSKRSGFDHHFTKPIDYPALVKLLAG